MASGKISYIAKVAMAAITIVSFANFFNLTIGENLGFAGVGVIIGVAFFFITKTVEKQPYEGSGFNIRAIPENLKDKKNWF